MKIDPAIDEIRETRRRISESVNHNPRELVKYYMKLQEDNRDRFIKETKSDQIEG